MFRLFISDMVGKLMETKSGKKNGAAPPATPHQRGKVFFFFLSFFSRQACNRSIYIVYLKGNKLITLGRMKWV